MSIRRNKRRLMKKAREKIMGESADDKAVMVSLVGLMAEVGPAALDALVLGGGTRDSAGYAVDGLMNTAAHMEAAIHAGDAQKFTVLAAHVLFLARHIAILQGKIRVEPEMAKA